MTNRCSKGCAFCYNRSDPNGQTHWTVPTVVAFVRDCVAHGIKAVSFGGGEPLEFDGVFDVLRELEGVAFRSLTTNGLPLRDRATFDALVAARPDKTHVSIHFPDRDAEVRRVIEQVTALADAGVKSGVNLVVSRMNLDAAARAAAQLRASGIGNERIVYLPMRGHNTPTPRDIARVAGDRPFQSMSCLSGCAKSERFCSIDWARRVAWCSYTPSRRPMPTLDHAGLLAALGAAPLVFCGGTDDA